MKPIRLKYFLVGFFLLAAVTGAAPQETPLKRPETETLFSKIDSLDSLSHTIVSGDTLFDLARKHETTIDLLRKLNKISGDQIYAGMKLKIAKARFSIQVNKSRNLLKLFADGKLLKRYRVATGTNNSTPVGTFKIVNKLKDPTWFHAGAVVPSGSPDNILGSRWLGFDSPGYGLHGTTLPETIGTQASKGCIRMLNSDVEEIYAVIPEGTVVSVQD